MNAGVALLNQAKQGKEPSSVQSSELPERNSILLIRLSRVAYLPSAGPVSFKSETAWMRVCNR